MLRQLFAIAAFSAAVALASAPLAAQAGGKYGGRVRGPGRLSKSAPAVAGTITGGLDWIATHQDEDGHWDAGQFMRHDREGAPSDGPGKPTHDVAVTALCALAFLGEGNTTSRGPHKDQLRRAVEWLMKQQDDDGLFGTASHRDFLFDHALGAYAMVEANGLSNDPALDDSAARALDYLVQKRQAEGVWKNRDGTNDPAATVFATIACLSGRFFKLAVGPFDRDVQDWLDEVTAADGSVPGLEDPTDPNAAPSPPQPLTSSNARTAAALFCRFFLGQDPKETPLMNRSAGAILAKPPVRGEQGDGVDMLYWYFGTYALYQTGGRPWKEWSGALNDAVVAHQRKDGNFAGSWDPVGVWGVEGGRVYATAISVLTLQSYYRYTRLVR